jgi:hypothetical protein
MTHTGAANDDKRSMADNDALKDNGEFWKVGAQLVALSGHHLVL